MGLDVYVGPLTRYYDGDWENAGERAARERAGTVEGRRSVPPRTTNKDKTRDKDRIRQAVLTWREILGESLGTNVPGPLEWDESEDAAYFTGRPGWDACGGCCWQAATTGRCRPPSRPPLGTPWRGRACGAWRARSCQGWATSTL